MNDKKVLVISHNCFSSNTNLGKTLRSYFCSWDNRISQLYFHSEVPNDDTCKNYYRFTDVDAVVSIFNKKRKGSIYQEKDIQLQSQDTRIDTGNLRKIYEYGRNRKPLICLLRDFVWLISNWNNRKLQDWLEEEKPEFIFLAAGDYSFPYKIALKISKIRNIPIVMCCFDDYYLNYQHKGEFLRKTFYRHLMRTARKTINNSAVTFATNPKMAADYEKYFGNTWPVLFTSTSVIKKEIEYSDRKGIAYVGNLGCNRHLQLITMGKALKAFNSDNLPRYIDVYSNETNQEKLRILTEENGIKFHGAIPYTQVINVISEAIAVIHTESFDDENRNFVKYSLSTKIAESLGSGTPLIAFGPSEVASMDYLIQNKAAIVATSEYDLEKVYSTLSNPNECIQVIKKQLELAEKNHSIESVTSFFKSTISRCVDKMV